ncbi:MAG TPA: hypothetical protein VFQ37_04040 [Mycobacterium sp.]|nr:hypothetical protein [Mycobacterium sp.]
MYRNRTTVAGAAIISAAVGLSGCSPTSPPAAVPLTSSLSVVAVQAAELPPAEALTGLLYRLADPAVPGAEKLDLIEGAKPTDAATLDRFATALKDGGYTPLTFEAADIAWSDRHPGGAVADVNVSTANPGTAGFSLPMEFRPRGDGWQLSQQTAEMLLAFGNSQTGGAPGATPAR